MKPSEFISALAPAAQASARASRVPASFVVAQGALESSWGESLLAKQALNLFGVKADSAWKGAVLTMNTREFLKGEWVIVPAKWRKYATWFGCMEDHAEFFHKNPRYAKCFEHKDGPSFAKAVAAAGYATDPQYANKLISIMCTHKLELLDV